MTYVCVATYTHSRSSLAAFFAVVEKQAVGGGDSDDDEDADTFEAVLEA